MDDPKAIAEAAERRRLHNEAVGKNGRPQSSPYFQQLSGQPWWSKNLSEDAVILADAHLASERSAAEAMRERCAAIVDRVEVVSTDPFVSLSAVGIAAEIRALPLETQ